MITIVLLEKFASTLHCCFRPSVCSNNKSFPMPSQRWAHMHAIVLLFQTIRQCVDWHGYLYSGPLINSLPLPMHGWLPHPLLAQSLNLTSHPKRETWPSYKRKFYSTSTNGCLITGNKLYYAIRHAYVTPRCHPSTSTRRFHRVDR